MIICDDPPFVFLSIPKNASRSVSAWLLETFRCSAIHETYEGAPQAFSGTWPHHMNIPAAAERFYRFAIVRDPVSRALSIWDHATQKHPGTYGIDAIWGPSFEGFARWLARGRELHPTSGETPWHVKQWEMFLPQADLLAGVHVDLLINIKSLPEGLVHLPFVAGVRSDLDRLGQGTHLEPRDVTPRAARFINEWAPFDQELLRLAAERNPKRTL